MIPAYNDEALTAFTCTVLLQPLIDALNLADKRGQCGEGLTRAELKRLKEAIFILPSPEGRHLLDYFVDSEVALAALGIE